MWLEFKVISVTLAVTYLLVQVGGQTWREYEGHCYTIQSTQRTYTDSKTACQRNGSYLIELGDMAELEYARSLINGPSDQYWVGLDYDQTKQKFYWSTNRSEPLAAMWIQSEPNFSGYAVRLATAVQAGAASTGSVYSLADNPAESLYLAICEKTADMQKFVNYRKTNVPSTNRCPMVAFRSRGVVECAIRCSNNKSCRGFQFNGSTNACTPYQFSSSCQTPQSSSLTMYILTTPRC